MPEILEMHIYVFISFVIEGLHKLINQSTISSAPGRRYLPFLHSTSVTDTWNSSDYSKSLCDIGVFVV